MEQYTDTETPGPWLHQAPDTPPGTPFGPDGIYLDRLRHGRPGPKSYLDQLEHGRRRTWAGGRRIPAPEQLHELCVPAYLDTDPPLDPAIFAEVDDDHPFVFRRATLPTVYMPDGTVVPHDDDNDRSFVDAVAATYQDPRAWRIGRTRVFHRGGVLTVSTVFLGTDMESYRPGPPILWETDIRDAAGDCVDRWRYASRNAALHGHRLIVTALRQAWAADKPGAPIRRRPAGSVCTGLPACTPRCPAS